IVDKSQIILCRWTMLNLRRVGSIL
ncbi:hypothetical protein A2U01_0102900, partial [Trifolium medium]|nr:hypothetical protein [Trifolium medium]